jgi:hypothetical protein
MAYPKRESIDYSQAQSTCLVLPDSYVATCHLVVAIEIIVHNDL